MEGWNELKKELVLYQKETNAIWYTDEPIFCSFTKKQIKSGYIISVDDKIYGICNEEYFREKICDKLFYKHEDILLCGVKSSADPSIKSRKIERSKMTLKLRYKILKRDHFKCVLCGATACDTELHIDHIIPVSKGGKTEDYNLRTLCVNCNLGKSND